MELEYLWEGWKSEECIGKGSFGEVYKIVKEEFGHIYEAAVKVIHVPQNQEEIKAAIYDGMDEESMKIYFRDIIEDLIKEVAVMSQLKGNTNIVCYEDHRVVQRKDSFGWDIYLRMELLTPLYEYINLNGFSVKDVVQMGIDICRALEICQKYNIIHRDIKPENIFISKLGDFKLGDFGVSRQLEKTTFGLSKKGTYNFMAPEVEKGMKYNSTVDIYSLGIVMYRFLNNNRFPFWPSYPQPIKHSDIENANLNRMRGKMLEAPCNAEGKLAEIVLKACAYNPEERYKKAEIMRKDLEDVLEITENKELNLAKKNTRENNVEKYTYILSINKSDKKKEVVKVEKMEDSDLKDKKVSEIEDNFKSLNNFSKDDYQKIDEEKKKYTNIFWRRNNISKIIIAIALLCLLCLCSVVGVDVYKNNKVRVVEEGQGNPNRVEKVNSDTTKEKENVNQDDFYDEIREKYAQTAVQYDGHVYAIFNFDKEGLETWEECKRFCEDMGGYLAVINSEKENEFLYDYVTDSGLHIAFFGYTDRSEEGNWEWVHGDSSYTNWADGQPNNGKNNKDKAQENYAEFYKESLDGKWNDAPFGSNTYRFICEWE